MKQLRILRRVGLVLVCGAAGCGDDGGGGGGDGGLDDVTRCEVAAAALADRCPADGDRPCVANAYAASCETGAAPAMLAEAIDCLAGLSGAENGCRVFSDPSGATGCIATAYVGQPSAPFQDILGDLEDVCESSFDPLTAEPPLFSRSAVELDAIRTCLDANTDSCSASRACTASAAVLACFTD